MDAAAVHELQQLHHLYDLAQKKGDFKMGASIAVRLSDGLTNNGAYGEASSIASGGAEMANQANDNESYVQCLVILARAYMAMMNDEDAFEAVSKVEAVKDFDELVENRAQFWELYGNTAHVMRKLDLASRCYDNAEESSRHRKDDLVTAQIMSAKGLLRADKGDFDAALDIMSKGRQSLARLTKTTTKNKNGAQSFQDVLPDIEIACGIIAHNSALAAGAKYVHASRLNLTEEQREEAKNKSIEYAREAIAYWDAHISDATTAVVMNTISGNAKESVLSSLLREYAGVLALAGNQFSTYAMLARIYVLSGMHRDALSVVEMSRNRLDNALSTVALKKRLRKGDMQAHLASMMVKVRGDHLPARPAKDEVFVYISVVYDDLALLHDYPEGEGEGEKKEEGNGQGGIADVINTRHRRGTRPTHISFWIIDSDKEIIYKEKDLRDDMDGPFCLDQLVSDARTSTAEESDRLSQAMGLLSAIYLSPIESELGEVKHVKFVADGCSQLVPFSALKCSDGKPLITKHTVTVCSSLGQCARLRRAREESKGVAPAAAATAAIAPPPQDMGPLVCALPLRPESHGSSTILSDLLSVCKNVLTESEACKGNNLLSHLSLRKFQPEYVNTTSKFLGQPARLKVAIAQGTPQNGDVDETNGSATNHRSALEMALMASSLDGATVVPVLSGGLPPLERFSRAFTATGLVTHVEGESSHSSEALSMFAGATTVVSQKLTLPGTALLEKVVRTLVQMDEAEKKRKERREAGGDNSGEEIEDIRDVMRKIVMEAYGGDDSKSIAEWGAFELFM